MKLATTRLVAVALGSALLLAACGGGTAPTGPQSQGAASKAREAALSLDLQAPGVALTAPENYASDLLGTLTLTATAADDVAVESVAFQVDGLDVGEPDTTPPFAASVDTNLYASGQHVVRARARDTSGNKSAWSAATVRFGGTRTQPAGFTRNESWVAGLDRATAIAQAPDGRFFIAQQGGALRIVKGGTLLPAPFMQLTVDSTGERGLIGIALHPDFANNGYVYVHYTSTTPQIHNRISRFTADLAAGGDVVVPGSERVLANLPKLGETNHNGGAIHFGVDGKLYVAVGDNKRSDKAQDLSHPFGKLLRFNDDGTIPKDNPFRTTQTGLARAIWAYGLRNPFTFAVQPETGRIHINDVGQNTWEEINLGVAGANYGWPLSEGPADLSAGLTGPLFAYKHSDAVPPGSGPGGFFVGFAIAGGAFYPDHGPFPKTYRNAYFFADYASHFIGRVDLARKNVAYAFATTTAPPVDLLVGIDGALYVLTRRDVTRISWP